MGEELRATCPVYMSKMCEGTCIAQRVRRGLDSRSGELGQSSALLAFCVTLFHSVQWASTLLPVKWRPAMMSTVQDSCQPKLLLKVPPRD